MALLPTSATDHYTAQELVAHQAATAAGLVWGNRPPADFDGWFESKVDLLTTVVASGQQNAVRGSADYVKRALSELGVQRDPEVVIDPSGLVGVASDGRTLEGLLYGPVITAKAAIAKADVVDDVLRRQAWEQGRNALEHRVLTQVADAERSSTLLHLSVRPGVGYTRLARAGACSRCLVLAGRFYKWSDGFLRHPLCMCRHIPAVEKYAGDLVTDPREAFDAMTEAEQNKRFTRAGADAIRNGANIGQVVNVRRGNSGLQTGAGKITRTKVYGQDLFISSEGTTKRGFAGKLIRDRGQNPSTSPRLMPETIAQIAESREEYLRLLELNGYAFDTTKAQNRGSLAGMPEPKPTPRPRPGPKPVDLDAVPATPKPVLTAAEKKAAKLDAKRATAQRRVSKSELALDKLADKTVLDAMPAHAKLIVDRAELKKVDAGKPADIDEIEKLARKVLDVELKLSDPDFDVFYLSSEIGPGWRDMWRDEWRRNLQDALHLAGEIKVEPTAEWPLPGLKRKGALDLFRANGDARRGRSGTEMARDVPATNPKFLSDTSFQINCQRVTQTYELRTRGYDVTANPNLRKDGREFTDERIFGRWTDTGDRIEPVHVYQRAKSEADIVSIAEQWGPGARGWICVDWKTGDAHIFNVEVGANGKARFYDAQTGLLDASSHLPKIEFTPGAGRRGAARMYRVDDKRPVLDVGTLVTSNTFIQGVEEVPR